MSVLPSPVSLRSLRQELLERSDLQGEAFCSALAAAADLPDQAAVHRLVDLVTTGLRPGA